MPTLLGEKRDGSASVSLRDGMPIYEFGINYRVRGSKTDTRATILQTTGIPIVGETRDPDGLGLCESVRADRNEEQPELWDVAAIFTSIIGQGGGGNTNGGGTQPNPDPTAWVPRRKTIFYQKPHWLPVDKDGNPYTNSAGDRLVGVAPRMRTLVAWRFIQFEPATVTDETIADRNETVNDATFKDKAAKTLLCCVEESEIGQYYGRWLRMTQYLLKYDPKDWKSRYLDVGWNYKSGGSRYPYLVAGVHVEGPLNGSGGTTTGDPAIRAFDDYATIDFKTFLRI